MGTFKDFVMLATIFLAAAISGCANLNPAQEAGIVTGYGARAPTNEVQQIYYLGVFDPREQIPPTIYRIRVHGQASAISGMQFASGWVPAAFADSLGGQISFDENGRVSFGENDGYDASLIEGRTLMAFGPEGVRKAPKDHRLVIVMGQDPQAYFSAIDETFGTLARVRDSKEGSALTAKLLATMRMTERQSDELGAILENKPVPPKPPEIPPAPQPETIETAGENTGTTS